VARDNGVLPAQLGSKEVVYFEATIGLSDKQGVASWLSNWNSTWWALGVN